MATIASAKQSLSLSPTTALVQSDGDLNEEANVVGVGEISELGGGDNNEDNDIIDTS